MLAPSLRHSALQQQGWRTKVQQHMANPRQKITNINIFFFMLFPTQEQRTTRNERAGNWAQGREEAHVEQRWLSLNGYLDF